MRTPGGDEGLDHEDTDGEREAATPAAAAPPAAAEELRRAEAAVAEERRKEDELALGRSPASPSNSAHGIVSLGQPRQAPASASHHPSASSAATTRPEPSVCSNTRTPSSSNGDDLQQVSGSEDKECGDDAAAQVAEGQGQHRKTPVRSKLASEMERNSMDTASPGNARVALEEGSPQQLQEGNGGRIIPGRGPGSGGQPAALIPHISMSGLRGPRSAPALGAKDNQACQATSSGGVPPQKQQAGPLGDLITWLDDADVGDVLDQFSLNELLQPSGSTHSNGGAKQDQFSLNELLQPSGSTHSNGAPKPPPSRVLPEPGMSQQLAGLGMRAPAGFSGPLIERQAGADIMNGEDDSEEDEFEEVPSDKEALPRAPPLAPSAAPLMRQLSPESSPRDRRDRDQPHQRLAGYCANPGALHFEDHNEEEEWFARQRLTGAIGRLVRYKEAESTPKDDILGLRCTRRGRIMVTAVRENGIAAKAGVAAGDELVSIDGRKVFVGHPAHVVHASLRAPVTLVFLGFVGKVQAEVRVKRPPESKCGLAPGTDVVTKQPLPVKLCDAVVFKQGESTSLLIARSRTCEEGDIDTVPIDGPPQDVFQQDPDILPLFKDQPFGRMGGPVGQRHSEPPPNKTIIYELGREDARNLIVNALGTTAAL